MITKEQLTKLAWDAGLTTLGAVGVGFVAKKTMGKDLGVPTTGIGVAKIALAIGARSVVVNYLEAKKYVPQDPTAN